jgi:hypothetical protein
MRLLVRIRIRQIIDYSHIIDVNLVTSMARYAVK